MRKIHLTDVTLAAESFGAPGDRPILLVMGATASMLGWPDALCQGLAGRGNFVVRYDHRDTGQSTAFPPGEVQYAVEDMADDLIGVMDAYGLADAHLVGMSLGGFIAQLAALRFPRRVASLTLIGSEPLGWDGAPLPHIAPSFLDHFSQMETLDWSDLDAVKTFLLGIERLCAGAAFPIDTDQAGRRIDAILARTANVASAFNHGMVQTRDDWTGGFRKISQPVLVIHGAEDPILPLPNGEALASAIGGARLLVLEGTGHQLPLPLIPDIATAIADFVESV